MRPQCARSQRGRRRGRALVEFAIVLSVALMLIFGVLEYAQVMMARAVLTAATDLGARMAASGTGTYSTSDIQALVEQVLSTQRFIKGDGAYPFSIQVFATDADGNASTTITDWTDAPFGTGIAVQADVYFPSLLPGLGILPNPIPMRAKSIACSEAS